MAEDNDRMTLPARFVPLHEKALDRFGRELDEGCAFYWIGKQDVVWRLVTVRKSVRPDLPAGILELTMVAEVRTGTQGGMPILDIIKCLSAEECAKVTQALGSVGNA